MQANNSEFSRGWRILVACFIGIAIGASSLYFYSLGIFIKPLAAEFGWSRGQASLGALVGTLCAALVAAPVGRLVDRLGAVAVALVSLALLALSFIGLGTLTAGLTSFIVFTAVLSLLTTGSTAIPYTRLIVAGFQRHRGIALGLALSGTGVGAMLVPALLTPFIAEHGWRAGYFALAGAILLFIAPIWLLLRSHTAEVTAKAHSRPTVWSFKNPAFVWLGIIFLCASIAIMGTVVHFVPMLTDAGFSPARAGQTAALIGVTAIFGRLIAGFLLDHLPARLVAAGLFAVAACGLFTLASGGMALAVPGALITGLAIGAEVDLLAFLVGLLFPRKVYGQTYGALYAIFLLGGAIGPALAGFLFDIGGDYRLWLLTAAGLLILAAASTFALQQPAPTENPGESSA